MKIGILGGTFDPPHVGHLIVAEHVRAELGLDRVYFIPAVIPPHKQRRDDIAPAETRLELLRLAVADNPAFAVSDLEVRRGGISYTVDTLRALRLEHPSDAFYLLVGMDNLSEFGSWKEPDMIQRIARVVVMTRPGFEADPEIVDRGRNMIVCAVPQIGISSSDVRQKLGKGRSVRYLVPDRVARYIADEGLYRGKGAKSDGNEDGTG